MDATTTLPTETLAFPCPATITKEDLEQTLTMRGKLEFVRSFNNVMGVEADPSGKAVRFEGTQAVAARIARAGCNV